MDTEIALEKEEQQERILAGVKFRSKGQVFFFLSDVENLKMGDCVLVQNEQGLYMGEVCALSLVPQEKDPVCSEGRVTSLAIAKDLAQDAENRLLGAEASAFCKSNIRERNMDMKLVDVEIMHDKSKMIFYFTAPARIDFRELVKDLIRTYHTRIELRQVGVRHEAQMIGGLGNCGRVCCCHSYLRTFAPVSIKMAKEQNLFLNPAKLSGLCGRLLCCLSFEQKNYEEFNKRSPKIGKRYQTSHGNVKVIRSNLFTESVAVITESGEEKEFTLDEWKNTTREHNERSGGTPHAKDGIEKHSPTDNQGESREYQKNNSQRLHNREGKKAESFIQGNSDSSERRGQHHVNQTKESGSKTHLRQQRPNK